MKLVSCEPTEPKDREAELLALFEKNSYRELRSNLDGGKGRPLRLALDIIDEDPKQPRQVFDTKALESLAASIRLKGVIQPIVVFPAVNGRHLLAFGARRLRASRLAGCTDIPANIREPEPESYLTQLIENQQRSTLSNSELAAAIGKLSADGYTIPQLTTICNLSGNYISAFRRVSEFPPSLIANLNTADIRALSELYSQWKKTPDIIDTTLHLLPDTYITVAEARRIIERLKSEPTHSDAAAHSADSSRAPNGQPTRAAAPSANDPAGKSPPAAPPPATPTEQPPAQRTKQDVPKPTTKSQAPILVICHQDREGTLVVDRRSHEPRHLLINFSTGLESIPLNQIKIVRID